MSNPLFFGGKISVTSGRQMKKIHLATKGNKVLFAGMMIVLIGLSMRLWNTEPVFFAHASVDDLSIQPSIKSPLFDKSEIFSENKPKEGLLLAQIAEKKNNSKDASNDVLKQKLYEMVGDAPIREMVPFISQRDEKVAAFLVGIAKKESSFGLASPSKNGETCYNYWGYKGEGERGTGMGYACFASAEEAIKVVGDRIEVLVNKDRNTPARMVNTWKCGTSCAGDAGAPGWISTVAIYFDKIVG